VKGRQERGLRAQPIGRAAGIVLALALGAAPVFAQNPSVIVTNPDARAFRIALQRFASARDDVDAARFREELAEALEFSSVFVSIDPEAFLGPVAGQGLSSTPPRCADWAPIGADALVEGQFEGVPGAEFSVEFRAVDVVRCRSVLRKRYSAQIADARRIARQMADDLVGAFTGTPGVASTELVFLSDRGGRTEVHVMEVDGSGARAVTRDRAIKGFPNWSTDGSSIVYMSYQYRRMPHLFRIVRRGAAKPGRILKGLKEGTAVYRGVHAPDGESLAVVVSVDGVPDIFRTDLSGNQPRRLTRDPAIDVSPSWSPDGSQLVFVSDRTGSPQLYIMNADGSGPRRLTFDGGYNSAPAWSPDGRWIAYEARLQAQFDIWLIDPLGQVNVPLIDHPRSDESPCWSPDSRKIAFHSTRRGNADIYVVDLDGKNLRRLTQGEGTNKQPNWGPRRQ
jgi:TolB protein